MSTTALSVVLVIGAITALFMGFLGIIQNDIKRVVAYSTLSQLGYMTVALGASAYSVAIFHLMTHASSRRCCSSAPARSSSACTTTRTSATWAACASTCRSPGSPPGRFAGPDRHALPVGLLPRTPIIEAVAAIPHPGAGFAYAAVLAGVFVTAFYSFRMYFLVFHGEGALRQGP